LTNSTELRDVAVIAGIGETEFLRRGTATVRSLVIDASETALKDAGLEAADVDTIITEASVMPRLVAHDEVATALGIREYRSCLSGFYGPGIAAAQIQAAELIARGQSRVVLSYFGVNWGSSTGTVYENVAATPNMVYERPFGYFGQPVIFATLANRYAQQYNGQLSRGLGELAILHRTNAIRTPGAQVALPMTYEDYLESPLVADPLRVADCCLLTDGAVAMITVGADRTPDLPRPAVYFKGGAHVTAPISVDRYFTQNPEFLSFPSAGAAVDQALDMAGTKLSEIDFAELYDCFTISVLMQIEDIGWCGRGEAVDFIADGHLAKTGDVPLNTHGGLLSHAYMVGATHITEAVRQLRGDRDEMQITGAGLGLIGLLGGPHYGALILGRERG
jgi:acetyl-CoA acetyltransferase